MVRLVEERNNEKEIGGSVVVDTKMIEKVAKWLKQSKKTVVLTGAGMSTESGIPDFRSANGWWTKTDPQKVASVTALNEDYHLFHEFYTLRLEKLKDCKPHEGHYILANWEEKGIIHSIATQNVDGFHIQAGNKNVDELHGSIHTYRCNDCHEPSTKEAFFHKERCKICNGKLRPNVVLFGEMLPEKEWMNALTNIREADLVIVIGTSLEVYPVNQLPSMTIGKTVYINLNSANKVDYFDAQIVGKAKETLIQLNNFLN